MINHQKNLDNILYMYSCYPGDHVVPEPKGKAEARHGGAEEGCRNGKSSVRTQEFLRKC